jgi:hypothetical protein
MKKICKLVESHFSYLFVLHIKWKEHSEDSLWFGLEILQVRLSLVMTVQFFTTYYLLEIYLNEGKYYNKQWCRQS